MVGSICQPGWLQHDRTRGIRDRFSGVLRSNAGLIDEYQRIDNRSFAAAANKVPINAAPADAASLQGAGEVGGDPVQQLRKHGPWTHALYDPRNAYRSDTAAALRHFHVLAFHLQACR
jgi:hypothetical protein